MLINSYIAEFFRLLRLMKKSKWKFIAVLLASCCAYPTTYILYGFVNKELINAVQQQRLEALLYTLILTGVIIFFSCIIDPVTFYLKGCIVHKVMLEIRMDLYRHILRLPVSYFESSHSGELISVISNDLNTMEQAFNGPLRMLIVSVLTGAGSIISILFIDWRLFAFVVILGTLSVAFNYIFSTRLRNISDRIQLYMGTSTQRLIDILGGIHLLKLFNIEDQIIKKYSDENDKLTSESLDRVRENSKLDGMNFLMSALNFLGVLNIGIIMVSYGYIDLGSVLAIVTLQGNVTLMFLNVGMFLTQIQNSLAGGKRILEVYDLPEEPAKSKIKGNNSNQYMVNMQNIHFSYGKKKVLENFNLSARKDQMVAITGQSGIGKTTVFKLLEGFYEPVSGTIDIGGKPMSEYSVEEVRSMIAYVSQEANLFDGTVEENIRYGKMTATMEEIIHAAKLANAHDFIVNMPQGYKTCIGEGGSHLSGGQRQRVAIARAILKNAPILLLDEATSALDSESEQLVQQALNELIKGRTVLVIAHRLSTIEGADLVYKMNKINCPK